MAEYTLKERKSGENLGGITVNFNTDMTGATVCANFKTQERATTYFKPVFTIAPDGLSATSQPLKLDVVAGRYFSDFTVIDAQGKETFLSRFYITIKDSTC